MENTMREFYYDSQGRMWWTSPANNKVGYFYLTENTRARQQVIGKREPSPNFLRRLPCKPVGRFGGARVELAEGQPNFVPGGPNSAMLMRKAGPVLSLPSG